MGIHRETPLNINLNINNERQDYKIGTVCVGCTSRRGKGEGRLMDLIYLYEIEQGNLL
jgi:hypothetical protein